MDGVQNVEFALDKPAQVALFKDKEIPLSLIAAEDAPGVSHPALDSAVDLGHDGGAFVL